MILDCVLIVVGVLAVLAIAGFVWILTGMDDVDRRTR